MVFVFLFLTCFTLYNNLKDHLCCYKWHYFILFYSFVYMYHIFFIHSSVGECKSTFRTTWMLFDVLAIVNSAAVNTGAYIFKIIVFSSYIPRSATVGSYGNSTFNFWGTSTLVFIVSVPTYIPTNSVGGFPFFMPSPEFVVVDILVMAILIGVRWHLPVVLICISLIINNVEHLTCAWWSFVSLLWRNVYLCLEDNILTCLVEYTLRTKKSEI